MLYNQNISLPPPQPDRAPASLDAPQFAALASLLNLDAFWEAEYSLLALYGLRRFLEAFV